jgi:hypothetical protein
LRAPSAHLADAIEVSQGEFLEMVADYYELVHDDGQTDWHERRSCLDLAKALSRQHGASPRLAFGDVLEMMVDSYEVFCRRMAKLSPAARARLCTAILARLGVRE